jgi:hypothetical protein
MPRRESICEPDVFEQDEGRSRSQHGHSDTHVFGGTYLTRDALTGMEQRLKTYADVAADGHDLRVFRRDQERSAALAHQLNELNQSLDHARRDGEPGSRYAVQHEYWRLAHEHQGTLAQLGARDDRVQQLEKQMRDRGIEPDPIPNPNRDLLLCGPRFGPGYGRRPKGWACTASGRTTPAA